MTGRPIPAPSTERAPAHRHVGIAVLLLGLLLGLLVPAAGLATAAPAAAETGNPDDDDEAALQVELTEISPAVLRPGEDLTIRGTVHNASDQTLTGGRVELIMQRHALSSRTAVEDWHDGTSSARIGTASPVTDEFEEVIEPGDTQAFSLTMPAGPTFAETSAWGPRGIEVEVAAGGLTGSDRSLLLWFPDDSPLPAPAELSVVLPLTPTSEEWQQAMTEGTPVSQAAADRLLPVLAETGTASWALDPALLETAALIPAAPLDVSDPELEQEPGEPAPTDPDAPDDEPTPNGSEPSPDGNNEDGTTGSGDDGDGEGDNTAPDDGANTGGTQNPEDDGQGNQNGQNGQNGTELSLREALVDDAAGRDVLQLGYADVDLPALAHAEDLSLWRLGERRGDALLEQAGLGTLEGVHWPGGTVDATSLDALAGEDVQTVITPERALADVPDHLAQEATTQVRTSSGATRAVVADDRMSALLIGNHPSGEDLDPLTARQLLLADTAAAIREQPEHSPGFLATLPRGVTEADLRGHLAELSETPWLDLTNLRGLLGRSTTTERTLSRDLPDGFRLEAEQVHALEEQHDDVARMASVLTDPQALLDQVQPAMLSTLSASWSPATDGRTQLLEHVDSLTSQVTAAVRVEPGSSVLLINHSGDLPVTVANDLPVPARVQVSLQPQDPRLRAGDPVEAVLEPQTITTVRVPVEAVANGNVDLDVRVLDEAGVETVGQSASFVVRVRADWEDIGTGVVAGLLAVGFVFGLVRTIRSGRRRFTPATQGATVAKEQEQATSADDGPGR